MTWSLLSEATEEPEPSEASGQQLSALRPGKSCAPSCDLEECVLGALVA